MKNAAKHDLPHEDLRQRRTKKFLVGALVSLMEERPFTDISVVDICERAMVHRTTFYAHFDDKYALLRYAVGEIQREFVPAAPPVAGKTQSKEYFLTIFRNALAFMRAHSRLYRSAGSGMDLKILEDVVVEELANTLRDPAFPLYTEGLDPDVTARFYAGAILSLIRWWLEEDMPVSDDVLLRHLERFLPVPNAQAQEE